MPLYRTAFYTVKSDSLAPAKMAIAEFVAAVNEKEKGARLYLSLQSEDDPTRFLHVMAFDDARAEAAHAASKHRARFDALLAGLTAEELEVSPWAPLGMDAPAKTRKGQRKVAKKPQRKAAKKKLATRYRR